MRQLALSIPNRRHDELELQSTIVLELSIHHLWKIRPPLNQIYFRFQHTDSTAAEVIPVQVCPKLFRARSIRSHQLQKFLLSYSMMTNYDITIRSTTNMDKYPAKSHARCVADRLGPRTKLIVLRGEKAENFSNSDMPRPFRQDRFFYYLSGANDPGCWLTYDIRADKLTLWLPPVNLKRVFYDGRATTVEEALEKYDIDEAKYIRGEKARCNLSQYIKNTTHPGRCACLRIPRGLLGEKVVSTMTEDAFNLNLREIMINCRAVKDDHELKVIRKSNEISALAHTSILKSLGQLTSEPQVEAVYTSVCIAEGAKQQSYGPICGSGPNASQLHYMDNSEDFGKRQTLLVDAGAEWQCYASDVTRTMPINPKKPGYWQTGEAETIYKSVEQIQETCIKMLGPGVFYSDVAWCASRMAVDILLQLGILKGSPNDVLQSGTWMAFFPHGLGHHMGLEVHDLSPTRKAKTGGLDHSPKRTISRDSRYEEFQYTHTNKFALKRPNRPEAPLGAGMVVTVEPGLYFNEFALKNFYLCDPEHKKFIDVEVLAKYMHVGGVRIEDDLLITGDGYENLTTAPKGKAMLKVIRDAAANGKN